MKRQIKRTLMIKESIINSIPTIIGLFIFIAIFILGLESINRTIIDDNFRALALLIYMLGVMVPMIKILTVPQLVYSWEEVEK